ncbi:MAG: hypothetical protein NTW28_20090 [Candidatus Solibacter sp.]|nr:hypothetical protein [Candidatus Solibacter sp.]
MKPHVGVLLAAGAIGGALIMQVARRPQTAAPAPVVAQAPAPPATAPATPPVTPPVEPASAPATDTPAKPSPVEIAKPVRQPPKPARTQRAAVRQPAAAIAPPSVPVAQPAPEPAPPAPVAPAPQPVPPARIEPENVTPPPPSAPPEPHRVTLNAGTMLPVRLVDGLTAERNLPGDSFTATLDKELVVDGFVIAEHGARVEGRVVASDKGGRVKSVSTLEVELVRLRTSDGQTVAIQTDGFARRAEETRRQDAGKVGAGAAIGAVIGAIAGGGKGAAIGAGVGGGAGAGSVMATRGDAATLPSETRVTFHLKAPVTITEKLR